MRLRKNSLQTLIGARWSNWEQLARDIGAALAFWALWYGALSLLKLGLTAARITNAPGSGMVYPSGAFQVALWIVNAILAGIVEETVFRGYLMKQFTAWTRSTRIGIVLQAVVFGSCHAYLLGVRQMVLITASGVLIGVFVQWRKSLRPAMVFHAWADIFGAAVVRGLPFQ